MQKIPLDAGFGCPHRPGGDHRTGKGCIYCNNVSFSPYSSTLDQPAALKTQLAQGIQLGTTRYRASRFIAYFQAFTNTYAPVNSLKQRYDVIKEFPEIIGLAIGTRPDCIDEEVLDLIASYSDTYETWIEYGLQSAHDATLARINRGHTVDEFLAAVEKTARRKILICVHVILGLPGEDASHMHATADFVASLPVHGIKIHHCHVIKDTDLASWYLEGRYQPLERDQYVSLVCDFLERIPWSILVQRLVCDAPHDMVLAPLWALNKKSILFDIDKEFERRATYQGALCANGRTQGDSMMSIDS